MWDIDQLRRWSRMQKLVSNIFEKIRSEEKDEDEVKDNEKMSFWDALQVSKLKLLWAAASS